jgi:hypothetical protein
MTVLRALKRTLPLAAMLTASILIPAGDARADKDQAMKFLKAMSDYVAAEKTISATFDASIEVVTPDLEKIQFNNSGEVLLVRPDKFRASRVGGYADVELTYDGKMITLLGKGVNAYAQLEATGSTDEMFERLRLDFGMQIPGADLLVTDVFDVLSADVVEAKYIGPAVIGGIDCEHLAFRNATTDWQLWVEKGAKAIPRKLVISTKALTGGPQYTLVIKEWKTDAAPAADAFQFVAPEGAEKMDLEDLPDIDELPAGVEIGGGL